MNKFELVQQLTEIREQIDALASEAERLVAQEAPGHMNWAQAYGVFNMTDSANPYDNTFAKLIYSLRDEAQEDEYYEGDDDFALEEDF